MVINTSLYRKNAAKGNWGQLQLSSVKDPACKKRGIKQCCYL
jgi:hypothetical protein